MDLKLTQEISNYNAFGDDDKNRFWIKFRKKQYKNTTLEDRVYIEHLSRLVKAYLEAEEDYKKILWFKYDQDTQR